jgi:hypothetical protein
MFQESVCSASRCAAREACVLICGGALAALLTLPASASSSPPAALRSLSAWSGPGREHQPSMIFIQAQGELANFRADNISGPAGRPIPLKIEGVGGADKGSGQLFIFSGLPKGVTLQPGGDFGEFWAVNASVIDDLTLTAPPGFAGTFTVWITRSRNQQVNAAQSASITVTIGGPPTTPTAASSTTAIPDTSAPAKPRSSGVANEAMLMARANESFRKGDVSGARVVYEYLAMQGSSAAAMAMGETYDPLVLAKVVVKGLDADAKKAQQWYEKAEDLGSQEARSRLNALAAR